MDSDCQQQCTFITLYRNTFLKSKIFSYLLASRKGYYVFNDSKLSLNYHQLNTLDLIRLNNISLLKEKYNRFGLVLNNNNNSNSNSFTCYQDWLDIDQSELYSTFQDNYDEDEIDEISLTIMNLIKRQDEKAAFVKSLLDRFGLTRNRLQIFNKYIPDKVYHPSDLELFGELVAENRIEIDYYSSLVEDQFFRENKDLFRGISDWTDEAFLMNLFSSGFDYEIHLPLLKWILTVSPLWNYDRYMQEKEKEKGDDLETTLVEYVYLYDIKIVYDRDDPFYHVLRCKNYDYAIASTEILQYTIDNYPEDFKKSLYEFDYGRMIDDPNTIRLLLEFNNFVALPFSIYTKSQDFDIIKFCVQHQQEIDGPNLMDTLEKLQYVVEHLRHIFDSHFEDCLILSIGQNHLEYMKYCLDHAPDLDGDHYFGNIFQVASKADQLTSDTFKYFCQWLLTTNNSRGESFDDVEFNLCLQLIKSNRTTFDQFKECYENTRIPKSLIPDLLFAAYGYLKESKSNKKQDAIKILEYLKSQHQLHLVPSSQECYSAQYFNAFIQDKEYVQYLSSPSTDLCWYIKGAFKIGSVALLERIVESMDKSQYLNFITRVEDILLAYFYTYPHLMPTQFKVPLYCFERFADQFSQSTLTTLSQFALIRDNHTLIDILLHRTKVRLIRPQSPEHDKQMLELNYMNLIKSQYFSRTNYFKLYPFTLDIDEKRLKTHKVRPFGKPKEGFDNLYLNIAA
ncbi:hypothetical protein CYY_005218 [Polysphondylium violaceum]|uniref:Uncharacterized protein n=1 Tax=Polysphondylium violaceum TaxID=133409 RepID=A0A8J4UYR4_9MYCE|nr:hypothetical protein CYY_005218 [Polysphondylium violaceum]